MARPSIPRSYDEITRKTVPNPDSSFRPSKDTEVEASARFHPFAEADRELALRIKDAFLVAIDLASSGIVVAVDGGRVTLRGEVLEPRSVARAESLVEAIEGVTHVDARLTVRPA